MSPIGSFVVALDDACLDGHFPDLPVVPGVVVLDAAINLLGERWPLAVPAEIVVSKFTGSVLPGQSVVVAGGEPAGDRVTFVCAVDGRTVATGTIRLQNSVP